MRRIILLIFPFLLSAALVARESKSDSLVAVSKQLSGSERAYTYIKLSSHLLDSLPDSALYYANQAELILNKNDPEGKLPSLFKLKGSIY